MNDSTAHSAVRRILTTAGIAGAALSISAAAALPALASHSGDGDRSDSGQARSHHAQDAQAQQQTTGGTDEQSAQSGDDATEQDGSDQDTAREGSQSGVDQSGKQSGQAPAGHGRSSQSGATGQSAAQAQSTAAGHNPPGNNGTVFIHDVAGDHSPHNVPHVGCSFYVDFFGFDSNQNLSVTFAGQAPTGKDQPLSGGFDATMPANDAGGGGNDFDLEQPVTLDPSTLGAPAHQGYHVKMTVTTNQPGGHKYKVFWIAPCTSTAPVTMAGTSSNGADTAATGTQTAPGAVLATTGGSTSAGGTVAAAAAPGVSVLGEKVTRGTTPGATVLALRGTRAGTAPASGTLPFTGGEIGLMSAAGAAALGGGAALTMAGRRRRRRGTVTG